MPLSFGMDGSGPFRASIAEDRTIKNAGLAVLAASAAIALTGVVLVIKSTRTCEYEYGKDIETAGGCPHQTDNRVTGQEVSPVKSIGLVLLIVGGVGVVVGAVLGGHEGKQRLQVEPAKAKPRAATWSFDGARITF